MRPNSKFNLTYNGPSIKQFSQSGKLFVWPSSSFSICKKIILCDWNDFHPNLAARIEIDSFKIFIQLQFRPNPAWLFFVSIVSLVWASKFKFKFKCNQTKPKQTNHNLSISRYRLIEEGLDIKVKFWSRKDLFRWSQFWKPVPVVPFWRHKQLGFTTTGGAWIDTLHLPEQC